MRRRLPPVQQKQQEINKNRTEIGGTGREMGGLTWSTRTRTRNSEINSREDFITFTLNCRVAK